ncbi:MAG: hypothetical protein JOZ44_19215 [Acidobacteria bacterium]|nr:hypothetical protein [Acidobacteriota bacterium]
MKSSRRRLRYGGTLLLGVALISVVSLAWAAEWKAVVSGSAIEAALYRWMPMPATKVLGQRPPREAVPLLSNLIQQQPTAEVYSLRAMNEEAELEFAAAESDWKRNAELAKDHVDAQLALADFYHRRLRAQDEIAALDLLAKMTGTPSDKLKPAAQQQSWLAFERMLRVAKESALPETVGDRVYRDWMARYPHEPAVYERYFQVLLDARRFDDAAKLVAQSSSMFPKDDVFPTKANAMLAYKRGSVAEGLAVYEKNFQPLWPAELVQSYFELLGETGSLRKYLDAAKASIEKNPDDLNAVARIFYYYQHQGRNDAAQQALTAYRESKEQRNAKWSDDELHSLAVLSQQNHSYAEAARYYYALYSNAGTPNAQEQALTGLVNVLLDAPEQDIRLGAGELSMYKDIATMDPGPGFLNGILSLILNTTSPAGRYSEEEQRAFPYFHREEAAELMRLVDSRFANSEHRAELHARLLETFSNYGESQAVIRDGKQFLSAFPNAPQREQVALLMADSYQRLNDPEDEFALYDSLLAELAQRANGVPLGDQSENLPDASRADAESQDGEAEQEGEAHPAAPNAQVRRAFQVTAGPSQQPQGPRSPEYARVLERFVARLVSLDRLPQALAVLRKELDRNPNDPGVYERLAQFLAQNHLGAEQEQVYQRAIHQFKTESWYEKLARFYLRQKRNSDLQKLSQQVVGIFAGTELDRYFEQEIYQHNGSVGFYRDLNVYAKARFPHDLVFVRNIAGTYKECSAPWFDVVEQHWWEAEDLRNEYFSCLSRSGRLEQILASLQQTAASATADKWGQIAADNPVAVRFIGEAEIWRCHYEESAGPLGALAKLFPTEPDISKPAAAVYRSLAAFMPPDTDVAVAIDENLYAANLRDRDQLAHIGDVLADRELFSRAAPFWERMTQIRPGEPQAYLDPATVYWDYYNFSSALRLLNEGRSKLHNSSLYSYEAGAIYENQRDYSKAAVEYVHGALKNGDVRARNRLLELARRPKLRDAIENATSSLVTGDSPGIETLKLRADVLEAESRPKELEQLLSSLAPRTNSLELLDWIEQEAVQKSFVNVQEAALEREAIVTADPVHRLEVRYALVRFHEQGKDLAAAQQNVDELYRENPKIMGVVRSTVDFYWRNKQPQKAIDTLLQAAGAAYPELRQNFQFEAARKATEAGDYRQAQSLLAGLLVDFPYNDQYLAAMAETYARSGDDQGLKQFYLAEIESFKKAPLPQEERTRETAGLRRGVIPALTRLKDYSGAVDQYIEIINKYPEDEALVSEAALYAQKRGKAQQLIEFYSNTVKQSPRDYRWAMVLARTYAQMEKFPEAIEAYAQAIHVRPDRTDLRSARADLLERLMRFDEAAAEYRQLYDLNYHDKQWMEKIAVIRARQGNVSETVAALQAALVANRPEKAENYFEVARRLEAWNMLQPARDYAQRGVDAAGRDLLAVSEHHAGAQLYARIFTRVRQQEQAYGRLSQARRDADNLAANLEVAKQEVESGKPVFVTGARWREAMLAGRRESVTTGMAAAMRTMGETVAHYFTPEEKAQFMASLESKATNASDEELAQLFLPAAQAADLPELEVRWLEKLLMSQYALDHGPQYERRLIELEGRRVRLEELGTFLESYARTLRVEEGRDRVILRAAQAYRDAGIYDKELATLSEIGFNLNGEDEQRLFALLMERSPDELFRVIRRGNDVSDRASQYVVENAGEALAMRAIAERGKTLPAVWTKAYRALTGLYFDDRTSSTQLAFLSALGDASIGDRIAKPVDRQEQLAGDVWFYYGTRYGVWLGAANAGDPDDFLPAVLEQSPVSIDGYVATAEYYSEKGNVERALADYQRALELGPTRADVHDRIAQLYWKQQKHAEGVREWKTALQLLDKDATARAVPPQFWPTFTTLLKHLGDYKLTPELHEEVDKVLREYVRKNGYYRAEELLRAAFEATHDPSPATSWMLQLAAVAPTPTPLLESLAPARWIPTSAKEPIYRQIVTNLQDRAGKSEGLEKEYAQQELRRWQLIYVRYLIGEKQFDRAAELLVSVPKQEPVSANELELELRIAIAQNTLDATLNQYRLAPEQAPRPETLRAAANAIQQAGMRSAARKLFEYLFEEEIADHNLTPANMLGLAEIRLQDGDLAGAMELLRRLTVAVGPPFENLEPAASLLARTGRHAEAAEILAQLVKAQPWDGSARLQLAEQQVAVGRDVSSARAAAIDLAEDTNSPYVLRVQAAQMLGNTAPDLGSSELNWLTGASANSPESADKPFYYPARVKAAAKADSGERIRLLMNALEQSQGEDSARLPLFFALVSARRDRLAISTIDPWLQSGIVLSPPEPPQPLEGDEESNVDDNQLRDESEPVAPALPRFTTAERERIAAALASAYERLHNFDQASEYYRLAARLQTAKAAKAELIKKRDEMSAAQQRIAANRLRAPQIHRELVQVQPVKPRLPNPTSSVREPGGQL